jgi:hypothetical protein
MHEICFWWGGYVVTKKSTFKSDLKCFDFDLKAEGF